MDLIYADRNGKDIGVLKAYSFDLAYGDSENNFELSMLPQDYALNPNYFVYIDNTEYGGIVDTIKSDINADEITCYGRTWHGIIEGKVIPPTIISGEANECINKLLSMMGRPSIFFASNEDSGIYIPTYSFERYTKGYTGLCDMLASVNAKLNIKHINGEVILSAEMIKNYADDEEWDSSQFAFAVTQNFHPVNHLICIGKGKDGEEVSIPLFTDNNGGIRDYTTVPGAIPYTDAHYIKDNRKQLLYGVDEVAEIFESNASVSDFYYPSANPSGNTDLWKWNINDGVYEKVVKEDGSVEYEKVEIEKSETQSYELLSVVPNNWSATYTDYYEKDGANYKGVVAVTSEVYRVLTSAPYDWELNYSQYYVFENGQWVNVSGYASDKYELLTTKPTDWNNNYSNYYEYKNGSYTKVTIPSGLITVLFLPNKFYRKYRGESAPLFNTLTRVATKDTITTAPTFTLNKYYKKVTESVDVFPSWVPDKYYKVYHDRYKNLAEAGVEKLKSYWNMDSIEIKFDTDNDYDIGDIVGATDEFSGVSVWKPISKKIVTINNEGITRTEYQIKKG